MTPETLPFVPSRRVMQRTRPHPSPPAETSPDLAVAALPLLERAVEVLTESLPTSSRWRVPTAHFFHDPKPSRSPQPPRDVLDDLLCLMGSVDVRHAARAVPGLVEVARRAAPHCRAAAKLLETLELVDDEVVRITMPTTATELRVVVRGVADFTQFAMMLEMHFPSGILPTPACQFVHPRAALRPGGVISDVSLAGDWFWGDQPLARLPRIGGERHVLVVPATIAGAPGTPKWPHITAELDRVELVTEPARQAA